MLYQLSYSPKNFGYLSTSFVGYSLGCSQEADVYPK
jgi:hypothetical protein